jgi:hypothetical protein
VVLFALALYWYGGMTVLDDMMHVAIWQNAAQAGSK